MSLAWSYLALSLPSIRPNCEEPKAMVITEQLSLLFDLRSLSKSRFLRALGAQGRDTPLLLPHDAVITGSETASESTPDTQRCDKGGAARLRHRGSAVVRVC